MPLAGVRVNENRDLLVKAVNAGRLVRAIYTFLSRSLIQMSDMTSLSVHTPFQHVAFDSPYLFLLSFSRGSVEIRSRPRKNEVLLGLEGLKEDRLECTIQYRTLRCGWHAHTHSQAVTGAYQRRALVSG